MIALGFTLLVLGVVLLVAEAHVPGGVLGVAGAIAMIGAVGVLAAALNIGVGLAVAGGLGIGAVAAGWILLAVAPAARARRARVRSGAEGLAGRLGVVRAWSDAGGQVFVDGALWRARHDGFGDEPDRLHEGDAIVVERVSGLTLTVRRAEEWELIA